MVIARARPDSFEIPKTPKQTICDICGFIGFDWFSCTAGERGGPPLTLPKVLLARAADAGPRASARD
eukprot:8044136-Heterocapsa_arctica.AAC.1